MFNHHQGRIVETVNLLEVVESDEVEKLGKTKFGGQPDWIEEPQWPLSKELNQPMRFIGQFSFDDIGLEEYAGKIAYIFMTEEDDEYVDGTWEHDSGENSIVIQSNGITDQPTKALAEGPSRDLTSLSIVKKKLDSDNIEGSRVGGQPAFMQGEEYPGPKDDWQFFAQIDSCSLPFELNFGDAGIGYAFISKDGKQGKFLWQCG